MNPLKHRRPFVTPFKAALLCSHSHRDPCFSGDWLLEVLFVSPRYDDMQSYHRCPAGLLRRPCAALHQSHCSQRHCGASTLLLMCLCLESQLFCPLECGSPIFFFFFFDSAALSEVFSLLFVGKVAVKKNKSSITKVLVQDWKKCYGSGFTVISVFFASHVTF